MTLNVVWWKFHRDQPYQIPECGDTWHASDLGCHQTAFLSDVFPVTECNYVTEINQIQDDDGAIIVLSGGHSLSITLDQNLAFHVCKLNAEISQLRWVIVVVVYDSESYFPLYKLNHPNMRIWVQESKPGIAPDCKLAPLGEVDHAGMRRLPVMYTRSSSYFLPYFKDEMRRKPVDWSFAGRLTDESRMAWTDALRQLPSNGKLCEHERDASNALVNCLASRYYVKLFAETKIIPCRPAPCTPETARMYDALEAGCVPIVPIFPANEGWRIRYDWPRFWQYLFGEQPPFPVISKPSELAEAVQAALDAWPVLSKRVSDWWKAYKDRLTLELRAEVDKLRMMAPRGGVASAITRGITFASHNIDSEVTVLVPTSPSPAHPRIDIIEETIASIRFHFPNAWIHILADGVRPEHEKLSVAYEEYKRRVEWNCNHIWQKIRFVSFAEHKHQSGMMQDILPTVNTPLILFVESDTPLLSKEIPWMALADMIKRGDCNLVRFPPDMETANVFANQDFRKHLMLDRQPMLSNENGAPVIRTLQWSQRPHLSSTEYYRRILRDHFCPDSKAFIELPMVSVTANAPWEQHKLVIYAPLAGPMARSYHLDARENEPTFYEKQVY